ncbi:MAG: MBL fold metallo-hydrolase [Anaerolineae bacterium]|nr:MBL fold metallo-hydrolase [Anaerolineae bacterium]
MTLELVDVTPTIALVAAPNNGRFPHAHSLLIRDGGVTALVDTGCGEDVLRALLAAHPVDFVICTHSHLDHVAGNWLLAGRPIWLPAGIGFETVGDVQALARRFADDPAIQQLWLETTVPWIGYRDTLPTHAYPPGHVFTIGGTTLHTIPAPGHLLDHTVLWEPQTGTLLATDIDFTSFGPWYGNPESDPDDFERSIRAAWALEPRTVISSHKGIFTQDIGAQFQAYLAHFARREAQLMEAIAEPCTVDELVELAIIYGRFPRAADLLRYFERVMLEKHLTRLARQGQAREVEPGVWRAA